MSQQIIKVLCFGMCQQIVEGDDVCFITGIAGTVEKGDCCAGVAIKWGTHYSWLDFLYAIKWF